MLICDCHTHSNCSFDAKNSIEEMCIEAIKKNVNVIAITDHCEAWMIAQGADCIFGDFDILIPKSNRETQICNNKYKSQIKVLRGIEIGEPMHDLACTKKAMSYAEYDFVLASVHNLRGERDFFYLEFTQGTISDYLYRYFNEMLETAKYADFDSLAHLTYPLRYIFDKTGEYADLSIYKNTIDEIFKALVSRKKALEINTSGLRNKMNVTMPDFDLIKRFKEIGGEYITIGSDAHNTGDLAKNIGDAIKLAKKAGFTHQTYYENRKLVLSKI